MSQRIKLLGAFVVEEEGGPSRLMDSAHGMALLAFLVYGNEIQSREFVADLLWEASSTRRSLMRLRELLARVRRWLPQLQATRMTVVFRAQDDVVVDLFALREALAGDDMGQLDEALQLYEGDFLANFHLPGASRFNEWLVVVREQLRVAVLDAHHRLCRHYSEAQRWDMGVSIARRWVALEPLDEVAHRWLMHMLARNGQVAAALRAYEACRKIVIQQLGIEPQAETYALARKLERLPAEKGAGVAADVKPPAALASGKPAPPGLLPANAVVPYPRNPDFVGREGRLLQAARLLGQHAPGGRRPVVAITGMGGVGKTQMAVEFCYRYGRTFAGGVFWIRFNDLATVLQDVAAAGSERGLGLYRESEGLTLAERAARVQRAWQETTPRLLVFDGCEDEALLAEWLPVSGGCCVLVTGRRPRWARALDIAVVALNPLASSEGSALLRRLARHVNRAESQEIAKALGHLPLALYLAGSFLERYRHIAPADYAQQLREKEPVAHPSLSGGGDGYSPTGHVLDVARTYDDGWYQLDAELEVGAMARQLLACAACLPAGNAIPVAWLRGLFSRGSERRGDGLLFEDSLRRLVISGFLTPCEGYAVVLQPLLASYTRTMCSAKELKWAQAAVARHMGKMRHVTPLSQSACGFQEVSV